MMAQLYSNEKLSAVCGLLPKEDQKYTDKAFAILRDDFLSQYSIDVEADSLTQADWGLEQEQRMAFVEVISQYLQSFAGAVETIPEMSPMLAQVIKFATVGFKGASELEGAIDAGIKAMTEAQAKKAAQPPEPSPEQLKAQAAKAESDARIQEMQMKAQIAKQQADQELEFMGKKFAGELQFKTQMFAMEMQHKQQIANIEAQTKQQTAITEQTQNAARFQQERLQDAEESEQRLANKAIEGQQNLENKPPMAGT